MSKRVIVMLAAFIVLAVAVALVVGGMNNDNGKKGADMQGMEMGHSQASSTSDSGSSQSQASAQPEQTSSVTIQNYSFTPASITVKAGTTVTWTNQDSIQHSVVADDQSADAPNGPLLAKGESYKFTFAKAGTYKYHCSPHPYMQGTVIVTE